MPSRQERRHDARRLSLDRRAVALLNSASAHRHDGALRTSLAARSQVRGGNVAEGLRGSETPTVAGRERLAQRGRPVRTSRYCNEVAVGTWPDAIVVIARLLKALSVRPVEAV